MILGLHSDIVYTLNSTVISVKLHGMEEYFHFSREENKLYKNKCIINIVFFGVIGLLFLKAAPTLFKEDM